MSRFRREDVAIRPSLRRRVFGFDVELDVPAAYLRSLRGDIPPDGRIPISEAEIPTPGAIEVTIEEGAP